MCDAFGCIQYGFSSWKNFCQLLWAKYENGVVASWIARKKTRIELFALLRSTCVFYYFVSGRRSLHVQIIVCSYFIFITRRRRWCNYHTINVIQWQICLFTCAISRLIFNRCVLVLLSYSAKQQNFVRYFGPWGLRLNVLCICSPWSGGPCSILWQIGCCQKTDTSPFVS